MNVFSLRSSCLVMAHSVHFVTPPPDFLAKPLVHTEVMFLPLGYGVALAKISSNVEYEGWGFGGGLARCSWATTWGFSSRTFPGAQ